MASTILFKLRFGPVTCMRNFGASKPRTILPSKFIASLEQTAFAVLPNVRMMSSKVVVTQSNLKHFYTSVSHEGKILVSENHPLSSNPSFVHYDFNMNAAKENSIGNKLKLLVQQYGSIAVVFHISLALTWLGVTYTAVYYGLDLVSLMSKFGITSSSLQAKVAGGASTFVVAYSIHKCFALVRLSITAACVPVIVRYLRKIGLMKKPPATKIQS